MRDGIVAIDGERDEHVGGRIGDDRLQEANELAEDVASVPSNCDTPHDIR